MKSTKKDLKFKHLILFDSNCTLCQKAVQQILSVDKKKLFIFSPLNGKSAKEYLGEKQKSYLKKNTLVLLENYKTTSKISIRSKAVFRIYTHIGGFFFFLGIFSYFPFLFDPIYNLIAQHRHKLTKGKEFTVPQERFLP
jgi:predicted DCC family thiol-disulfide oxidoreductase YuxK